MKLVGNAKRIAAVSYSFWLTVAGIISMVVPELFYGATGIDLNPYLFWFIGILLLIASLIGRLIEQPQGVVRNWIRIFAVVVAVLAASVVLSRPSYGMGQVPVSEETAAGSDVLEIAVPLIAKWEGKRNRAYLDIVGVPTICYGSTRGVQVGDFMSDQQCLSLLRAEVAEYHLGWQAYLAPETLAKRLTAAREAAYTSLAFNVGISGAGKSTATRRLNTGDIAGGCHAITWWNKAGGRVVRGLVNRRAEEYRLCMARG